MLIIVSMVVSGLGMAEKNPLLETGRTTRFKESNTLKCDFNPLCTFHYVPISVPKTLTKMRQKYRASFKMEVADSRRLLTDPYIT